MEAQLTHLAEANKKRNFNEISGNEPVQVQIQLAKAEIA
jgi:hypothetical protein